MAGPTGDIGSAPTTTTVAIILAVGSVLTAFVSSWWNRRPKRRRTEPAEASPDSLPPHGRITTIEQHVADLKAEQRVTNKRLDRLEEREWPTDR